jgi:hypothetical protein
MDKDPTHPTPRPNLLAEEIHQVHLAVVIHQDARIANLQFLYNFNSSYWMQPQKRISS